MKQRGTRKGRVLKFTFDELAYTSAEEVEDPESGEMVTRVTIRAAKFDAGTLKILDAWDNNKATIVREVFTAFNAEAALKGFSKGRSGGSPSSTGSVVLMYQSYLAGQFREVSWREAEGA